MSASILLAGAGTAGADSDSTGSVTGYCAPESDFYGPFDVPPGGSTVPDVPRLRTGRIDAGGISTPVLASGPRRGREAVVFIHGNPGSSSDWTSYLPRVGRHGIRAVAFDFPGFGHADKPWDFEYTTERYVRFFRDALRALRIRRVHVVAHDIGTIALFWATKRPDRLASVSLINAGFPIGYRHHGLARTWRTPEAGEAFMVAFNREFFAYGLRNGEARPVPREDVDRIYDDYDRATRCAVLDLYRSFPSDQGMTAVGVAGARVLRRADRRRPALVIWGRHDPFFSVANAKRQRRAFPAARVEIFEDSGHWPFLDDPRRTRRELIPFLREQAG